MAHAWKTVASDEVDDNAGPAGGRSCVRFVRERPMTERCGIEQGRTRAAWSCVWA